MKTLTLVRVGHLPDGMFGVLLDEAVPFCLTVERPWLNNEVGRSCIPVGRYLCKRVKSPRFGNTFEVTNVPGRSLIRFHTGNIADDSHGCIVVGEQYESLDGKNAVKASGKAFAEFLDRTAGIDAFFLNVLEIRL